MGLADLLRPPDFGQNLDRVERTPDRDPGVMEGTIRALNPTKVVVPEYDGGKLVHRAFGYLPRPPTNPSASAGDKVQVKLNSRNQFVVVAWERASGAGDDGGGDDGDLAGHIADTTGVHGIENTADLILEGDTRLTDPRAPTAHTHDERYYTETEVDSALAGKQDAATAATDAELNAHKTSSDHDGRYYTEAEVDAALSGKQPLDIDLTQIAALASAADKLPYATGAGTWAMADYTAAARALLDDVDAAAMRTTLGLAIGTDVQAYDGELAALAGLVSAADKLPYFTGVGTAALATLSSFMRTLLDDPDAAAARTTLGAAATSHTHHVDDLTATGTKDTTTFLRGDNTWGVPPGGGGGAPIDSPTFTGDPKAPTPSAGDNDTSIATTAFVTAALEAALPKTIEFKSNATATQALTTSFVTMKQADNTTDSSVTPENGKKYEIWVVWVCSRTGGSAARLCDFEIRRADGTVLAKSVAEGTWPGRITLGAGPEREGGFFGTFTSDGTAVKFYVKVDSTTETPAVERGQTVILFKEMKQ